MAAVRSWDVAADLPPFDARDLIREEREVRLALLDGLARAAWTRPTVCVGWTVHDVALHLLGNDLGRLSGRRDGWVRVGPDAPGFAALASMIERSNEEWVRATRPISPRLLLELSRFVGEMLDAYLAAVDLDADGVPVAWTGTGPSPYWLDIAREYTERWIHQQQIRDALGSPGMRERRWLFPVLDAFMRSLPRAYEEVAGREGRTVVVEVTGDAGGSWALRRGPARWHLIPVDDVQHPDAVVRMPETVAWRLLSRMVSVADALPSIERQGDPALVEPASRAVAIMTTRL